MRPCGVSGCERKFYCRGYCQLHYERLKRTGTTDQRPAFVPAPCSDDDCHDPSLAKGLCRHHYNLAHYATNAVKARERAKTWYWANPEKAAAARERRDKQTQREYARRYYWANPLRGIVSQANSKAKRLGVQGVLTVEAVAARIALYGGRCWVCGDNADTIDHVIPFAMRGPNLPANIRPACLSCNCKRGAAISQIVRQRSAA